MTFARYVPNVSDIEALHTAARRYCADRAALWSDRYAALQAREATERRHQGRPEPTTFTYSTEALATFPRYQVLQAIQWAVEAFTAGDFASLAYARELLAEAGESAESVMTRAPHGEIERQAMDEERTLFAEYVRELSEDELAQIEPLPFRRTLTAQESKRLWSELKSRWGIEGFYWYPLDRPDTAEPPQDAVALGADPFFDAEVQARLRDVLANLAVSRLWELRELDTDADCELDLKLFEPIYTGAEGFWTDSSLDWLIYASHEGSVTVAGPQLLPAFQQAFPEWREWIYAPDWQ
jgi:hypothetical protein